MTFIPMGIWLGAPDITVGLYIWKGIIPTLLGNIIGGALFAGRSPHFQGAGSG
jgi:formate/nitrite transporter FocA (FNT family)